MSPICGSCSDCEFPTSTIVTVQDDYKDYIHVGVICGHGDVTFEWRQRSDQDPIRAISLGYECTGPDGNIVSVLLTTTYCVTSTELGTKGNDPRFLILFRSLMPQYHKTVGCIAKHMCWLKHCKHTSLHK